ncbi:MAG: hypothetical protein V5A48_04690 [Salinivenus sp.]
MVALLVTSILGAVIGGLLVGVFIPAMGMVALAVASARRKGNSKCEDKKARPE